MSLSVDTKNRVTSPGFTYDDAGNLTSDGSLTYTWDAENRLTSANGVTYTYDGDGNRVKKSSGTLYWYGQDGKVLEETDLSGNYQHDYIYALGMLLARVESQPGAYYAVLEQYITDPLGSIRYVQGPNNTHAESDYYPFGGERVVSNTLTTPNNYKFTGLERDTETGLDHTLFRQYSSNLGRWLSPDPWGGNIANPQSLNRYGYVLNNPTTLTDPLGLNGDCPQGAICITVSAPAPTDPFVDEFFFNGGYGAVASQPPTNPDQMEKASNRGNGRQVDPLSKVKNFINNKLFPCLFDDPNCLGFLGPGALNTLVSLNIGFTSAPANVGAITTLYYNNPANQLQITGSLVDINLYGAFFYGQSKVTLGTQTVIMNQGQSDAFILLHELGHITGVLPPDTGNAAQSDVNNNTVWRNCSKSIHCCGH